MNYGDVFRKSDLGREEIKSQSLGVLPREARTLLIMIDGRRTYQSYLNTLDSSKMFAEFGGITPLFELLLSLECIEIAVAGSAETEEPTPAQTTTAVPVITQSQPAVPVFDEKSEIEFNNTFNNKSTTNVKESEKKSISSMFKTKSSSANYETIKSDLATYIEKNAPPVEAWGYLLSLEQCGSSTQLLILAKEIQNTDSGNLSRGMNDFIKRIQR
ncbi:hypothetical protein I6E84_05290 [Psychrobacter sp. SCQQ22]|uniref:hypothetical protein n=1 Tax=Psychrobacter sp. SCQQ22 TaxID=2792059 RepID=UPI0018CD100B|nr:hypothetical protein [Psychrobacter sp. SCQQ22]MBH0085631.1 hypothetical protein [Psychrobacter sp. SCQQ22]